MRWFLRPSLPARGWRVGGAGAEFGECRFRATVGPQKDAEVVVQDGDFAALSFLGGEPNSISHVVDATGIAEASASGAAVAERPARPADFELICQAQRTFGRGDRPLVAALHHLGGGDLAERVDKCGIRGQRFEQRQRLVWKLGPTRIPENPQCITERVHSAGLAVEVMPLFEGVDGGFQRLLCIGTTAGVKRGLAKPCERVRAVGM